MPWRAISWLAMMPVGAKGEKAPAFADAGAAGDRHRERRDQGHGGDIARPNRCQDERQDEEQQRQHAAMPTGQADRAAGKIAERAILLRLAEQKRDAKQHCRQPDWKASHNRADRHAGRSHCRPLWP